MKLRLDYVTNSSNSSFLICKKKLSENQLEAIREHSMLGMKLGLSNAKDAWYITESENFIAGSTGMDNFLIGELFEIIGIQNYVTWNTWLDADEAEEQLIKTEHRAQYFGPNEPWEDILNEIKN